MNLQTDVVQFQGALEPAFADLASRVPAMLEFVGLTLVPRSTRQRLFTEETAERVAQMIHERYQRRFGTRAAEPLVRGSDGWAANMGQALAYPVKLAIAGYDIVAEGEGSGIDAGWTDVAMLELLAEVEHRRWCLERRERGWVYGSVRDDDRLVHPDLRPYIELDEETKEKDRLPVRDIPHVLAELGLSIVPMSEVA